MKRLSTLIGLALLSGPLLATMGKGEGSGVSAVPSSGYLEAILSLLLVLGLILGLAWAVKRMGIAPVSKGNIRIVGGISLGTRERALILEVEGKRILVGVTPGQVTTLLQLEDVGPGQERGTTGADLEEQEQRSAGPFSQHLLDHLRNMGKKGDNRNGKSS